MKERCPQCNAPLLHGDAFCSSCGAKIAAPGDNSAPHTPRYCAGCKTPLMADDIYCSNCGAPSFQPNPTAGTSTAHQAGRTAQDGRPISQPSPQGASTGAPQQTPPPPPLQAVLHRPAPSNIRLAHQAHTHGSPYSTASVVSVLLCMVVVVCGAFIFSHRQSDPPPSATVPPVAFQQPVQEQPQSAFQSPAPQSQKPAYFPAQQQFDPGFQVDPTQERIQQQNREMQQTQRQLADMKRQQEQELARMQKEMEDNRSITWFCTFCRQTVVRAKRDGPPPLHGGCVEKIVTTANSQGYRLQQHDMHDWRLAN